uniref:Solute carrier family 16 member 12 n=1 Tax=Rousettus aegyptiacus TaxID=9407 RepID=A0A7J8GFX9_ROUAE|nr:solute carrier family 16 member 12 [Rousettus aegyptiacus]
MVSKLFDRTCTCRTHSSLNPQVSEELPVCLLPLCRGTGWALLSLPSDASKSLSARAFLLYLWLLRWCLCDSDASSDRRNSGDDLFVLSTRCGVLSSCSAILGEPTYCRLVKKMKKTRPRFLAKESDPKLQLWANGSVAYSVASELDQKDGESAAIIAEPGYTST